MCVWQIFLKVASNEKDGQIVRGGAECRVRSVLSMPNLIKGTVSRVFYARFFLYKSPRFDTDDQIVTGVNETKLATIFPLLFH